MRVIKRSQSSLLESEPHCFNYCMLMQNDSRLLNTHFVYLDYQSSIFKPFLLLRLVEKISHFKISNDSNYMWAYKIQLCKQNPSRVQQERGICDESAEPRKVITHVFNMMNSFERGFFSEPTSLMKSHLLIALDQHQVRVFS